MVSMAHTIFRSKSHRATVTHADLHYVGSVTVDRNLLDAAEILPGELVAIVNVTNGARLQTCTIVGEQGPGPWASTGRPRTSSTWVTRSSSSPTPR